jgi:hypothetical protein
MKNMIGKNCYKQMAVTPIFTFVLLMGWSWGSFKLNILALHLLEEIGRLILLDIFARTCQKQASEPEKP